MPHTIVDYKYYSFTPTEALVLEVLTARYRLGEVSWSLDSSANKALKGLETKGLVHWKSAMVEGASLAWFTDLGKAVCLSAYYRSHENNEVVRAAQEQIDALSEEAAGLKEKLRTV